MTPADLAAAIRLAVDNTLADEGMMAAVEARGYDRAELEAIRTHVDEFVNRKTGRVAALSDQISTTARLNKKRKAFRSGFYVPQIDIARKLFRRDPAAQVAMGLKGERAEAFPKLVTQAQVFYDNALRNPAYVERLSRRGITQDELEEGLAWITRIINKKSLQKAKMGAAMDATVTRDEMRQLLADWFSEFRLVAKYAFRENPTWMVRIGLKPIAPAPPPPEA
jgi:hypothetical protein